MDSPTPKDRVPTPASPSPLLASADIIPRKPTRSLAPEVVQPSSLPEVIREDQDPKYVVVDDENAPHLPKKDKYAPGVGDAQAEKVDDRKRGRICGLGRRTFWIVLVVAAVVVAGAVGGGVGGALAEEKRREREKRTQLTSGLASSTSSTSPSSTTSTANSLTGTKTSSSSSSSPTATGFSNGCPTADQTVYTPLNPSNHSQPVTIWNTTLSYTVLCSTNYASKSSGSNPQITELQREANISTLEDCLTACAKYNYQLPNWQTGPSDPNFGILCSMGVYGMYSKPSYSECFLQAGDWSNATNILVGTNQEIATGVLEWPGIGQ